MKSLRFSIFVLAAAVWPWLCSTLRHNRAQTRLEVTCKILRVLAYVENGHPRNKLDLYLPEDAKGPLPVVVWIHGGAWWAGNKDGCRAAWLTGKGYAVASINYRLSQHAVFPAQINDCKAAIRWLRANAGKYHFDPDHIGVWGASAGGHLVALLGTTGGAKELEGKGGNADQSSRVQCVVDWFGPTDMVSIVGSDEKPDGPVEKLIGGTVKENLDKAKKASPMFYMSKDSAPFLIMHGDKDPLVPLKQSEDLAAALKNAGVEAKLQVIKDNGHGGPGFNTPESKKLIEDFFDKHLKGKEGGKTGMTPQKPRVLVTISKETTYITGPLRKDGYVDYLAALNERFRKGATPENNAAVLFWQAMGPGEIDPETRTRYFKMLDMKPLAETGDYFVTIEDYVRSLKGAEAASIPQPTDESPDPMLDQVNDASKHPWSKKEFPVLASWLAANEKPLALVVAASKRPCRYEPMLTGNREDGLVMRLQLPAAKQTRTMARALAVRAMSRLKDGRLDGAWDDLMACHRLARLAGQGATLIDAIISISVDGMACTGDNAILETTTLDAAQIAKMRADHAKLQPMPSVADKIAIADRFAYLDSIAKIARDGFGSLSAMENGAGAKTAIDALTDTLTGVTIDWDEILRDGNSWFDRMVSVCRTPARKQSALTGIDHDLQSLKKNANNPKAIGILLLGGPRNAASKWVGNRLVGILLPAVLGCIDAEYRAITAVESYKSWLCVGRLSRRPRPVSDQAKRISAEIHRNNSRRYLCQR